MRKSLFLIKLWHKIGRVGITNKISPDSEDNDNIKKKCNFHSRTLSTAVIRLSNHKDDSTTSSSDSSSDDEEIKKDVSKKVDDKLEAAKKLNALLNVMLKEEVKTLAEQKVLNLAKPREKQRQKASQEKERINDEKKFGKKIAEAVKKVAEEIGGDVKQTEAELLAKVLYKNKIEKENVEDISDATSKKSMKEDAARSLGTLTLKELLTGMKIDRTKETDLTPSLSSRAEQVKSVLGKGVPRKTHDYNRRISVRPSGSSSRVNTGERVDIFGAEPLGIFKQNYSDRKENELKLEIWDKCFNKELKLATTQPPKNIYEQMILWTERGMLWHFPIDNEQGLEEEKKVCFSEHIHLEQHVDSWCPTKGPIRHFMELICIALSKNPWLTVVEKHDHIQWYKEYFTKKSTLLKEIGAGEIKLQERKEKQTNV